MEEVNKNDIKKIKKMVEEEFPNDPALQQVHIARKIIAREAAGWDSVKPFKLDSTYIV